MIRNLLLDLDGTVYRGREEVPGAARFVAALRARGIRHLFVTNRANRTPAAICEHLRGYGIACEEADVLTSAQATAQRLPPGRAFCIGEEGLRMALEQAGFRMVERDADYVIVSFDRAFDYARLERACRLIQAGARFVATNTDRCLNTEQGLVPGTGAIVAAVAAGSGVEPLVIGKPEPLIFESALERLGAARAETIAVGDSLATDIPAGRRAGLRTALMLTGVSSAADLARAAEAPTWVCRTFEDLAAIVWPEAP